MRKTYLNSSTLLLDWVINEKYEIKSILEAIDQITKFKGELENLHHKISKHHMKIVKLKEGKKTFS